MHTHIGMKTVFSMQSNLQLYVSAQWESKFGQKFPFLTKRLSRHTEQPQAVVCGLTGLLLLTMITQKQQHAADEPCPACKLSNDNASYL